MKKLVQTVCEVVPWRAGRELKIILEGMFPWLFITRIKYIFSRSFQWLFKKESHEILSDLLTKFNRFLQDSYEECCNSGIVCDDRILSHQQLVTWIYYCLKDIKEFRQEIEKLFNDDPETLKEYIAHHRCSEDDERKLKFAYLKTTQEAQKELQEYHEEEPTNL